MKLWIIGLVGVGLVIAVVIGVASNSQSVAENRYCRDLEALQSSVTSLTSLTPTSSTQGEFQSNVGAVQSAWGNVKISAGHLSGVNLDALDNAWNDFSEAVKGVPSSASVSDAEQAISQSTQELQSAVRSSIDSYDCTSA
jgi:hypothetical protein